MSSGDGTACRPSAVPVCEVRMLRGARCYRSWWTKDFRYSVSLWLFLTLAIRQPPVPVPTARVPLDRNGTPSSLRAETPLRFCGRCGRICGPRNPAMRFRSTTFLSSPGLRYSGCCFMSGLRGAAGFSGSGSSRFSGSICCCPPCRWSPVTKSSLVRTGSSARESSSATFKKVVGMSPSEFQDTCR